MTQLARWFRSWFGRRDALSERDLEVMMLRATLRRAVRYAMRLRSGKLTAAQEAREYVQVLDEAYEVINWTREDARR